MVAADTGTSYEAPTLVVIGSLAELTQADNGPFNDGITLTSIVP